MHEEIIHEKKNLTYGKRQKYFLKNCNGKNHIYEQW